MASTRIKLRQLGLSGQAIDIYETLRKKYAMDVSELAAKLGLMPNGLYRVIKHLEEIGFIVEIGNKFPRQYQARPLYTALDHYMEYQRRLVDSVASDRPALLTDKSTMKILVGRAEIMDVHISLIKQAKEELMTIAIGTPIPEKLYTATGDAMNRGVKNYYIYQVHDKENDMRLRRWVALGSRLRILPLRGFHLHIVDKKHAILVSTSLENDKERTGVLINSPAVVNELRKYFFERWSEAKPL